MWQVQWLHSILLRSIDTTSLADIPLLGDTTVALFNFLDVQQVTLQLRRMT
jgi:hypothetical protein